MARAWRIQFEGALYHILSRGNERRRIFYDDQDRRTFLELLAQMAERFEGEILGYVLMDNHYHLLVRTKRGNISKAMQWFGVTYTRRFNDRHSRTGHLFQGRFRSILVENESYLLQLSFYIHRNPLRAQVVKRLVDYKWSSYPCYAYGKRCSDWLSTDLILSQFSARDKHAAYREKIKQYAGEEKRLIEDIRHGIFLGTERFVEKIRSRYLPSKPNHEIPEQRHVARIIDPGETLARISSQLDCDIESFRSAKRISKAHKNKRDLLVYTGWKTGLMTNRQIGDLFGLSYSAVSHIVSKMEKKMHQNPKAKEEFDKLYSQFKI